MAAEKGLRNHPGTSLQASGGLPVRLSGLCKRTALSPPRTQTIVSSQHEPTLESESIQEGVRFPLSLRLPRIRLSQRQLWLCCGLLAWILLFRSVWFSSLVSGPHEGHQKCKVHKTNCQLPPSKDKAAALTKKCDRESEWGHAQGRRYAQVGQNVETA